MNAVRQPDIERLHAEAKHWDDLGFPIYAHRVRNSRVVRYYPWARHFYLPRVRVRVPFVGWLGW